MKTFSAQNEIIDLQFTMSDLKKINLTSFETTQTTFSDSMSEHEKDKYRNPDRLISEMDAGINTCALWILFVLACMVVCVLLLMMRAIL